MKSMLLAYLFELVDRNVRFFMHLEKINHEFYLDAKGSDKVAFIDEYKVCLKKQFEMIHVITKEIQRPGEGPHLELLFSQIRSGISLVGRLHSEGLHFLPRPSEPVELERFSRIIDSQYIKWPETLKETSQSISFFPTEDISETVFKKSALEAFKDEINDYVREYNLTREALSDSSLPHIIGIEASVPSGKSLHITIPRIDSANPARWPTLLHEIAHHIIADDFFDSCMLDDFKSKYLDMSPYVHNVFQGDDKRLSLWLLECWCDIFATFVIGPSFFFSQYAAFLFAEPSCHLNPQTSQNYPPAALRLKLILVVMQHRWKIVVNHDLYKLLSEALNLYRKVSVINSGPDISYTQRDIDGVYQLFKEFFLGAFFRNETLDPSDSLKDVVKQYFRKIEDIDLNLIDEMVNNIKKGYPVPSAKVIPDKIDERPTSLQEILLSAWIYRQRNMSQDVVDILSTNKSDEECYTEILEVFSRYDQSILRSIQVSEWFQLFFSKERTYSNDAIRNHSYATPGGMFVDCEIYRLLERKNVVVSPLISLEQIGSSSLDVRLGTSFQIFNRTGRGFIDFTDEESTNTFQNNSKSIDLDFLESITIHPGQFVLGHTMEYIKLEENLAAEIEGRSSFARMGLEIHMTAGFIDPGFEGVITLEIFNAGTMPVVLYPGMRIAQLRFIPVNTPARAYNRKAEAKYKGFLTHNYSLQDKDLEVKCIKEEKLRYYVKRTC